MLHAHLITIFLSFLATLRCTSSTCQTNSWGPKCQHSCPDDCNSNIPGETTCHHNTGCCLNGCRNGETTCQCSRTCYSSLNGVASHPTADLHRVSYTTPNDCVHQCNALAGRCRSFTLCPRSTNSGDFTCMLNKDELNSRSSMSRTFDPPPKDDNRGCQTYYRDTCSSFDPSVASAAYLNLAQLAYSDSPASCIQHAKLNGNSRVRRHPRVLLPMSNKSGRL